MNTFYVYDGRLGAGAGVYLNGAIREAIRLAGTPREEWPKELRDCASEEVTFTFNDVRVTVTKDSDFDLILRDWHRASNGYIEGTVGPKPKAELSPEEKANDARIEAENKARWAASRADYKAKAEAHRNRVEVRMTDAPEMEFSNEAAWRAAKAANESDFYGAGILAYAERWARMMQLEMAEGKSLEEAWERTSHEADLEGMSGASQGFATHLLTMCWVHGKQLRRLHNTRWGSNDTDGTVNPAILSLSKRPKE